MENEGKVGWGITRDPGWGVSSLDLWVREGFLDKVTEPRHSGGVKLVRLRRRGCE
jgi:hypothetical protein